VRSGLQKGDRGWGREEVTAKSAARSGAGPPEPGPRTRPWCHPARAGGARSEGLQRAQLALDVRHRAVPELVVGADAGRAAPHDAEKLRLPPP